MADRLPPRGRWPRRRSTALILRRDYGFDLQVDQAIEFAAPPARLLLFKGTFDPEDVLAALDEVGYQPVTVNGHELLSIRDDYEIDADAPTTYLMAHMNFGVVLPDGTLAFSSAGAPLAAVLNVAAGAAPSMLEQAGIAMLIGQAPPDLVSAMIVHGFMLQMSIPSSITDVIGTPDADFDVVATAAASQIATASGYRRWHGVARSTAGGHVRRRYQAPADL